MDGALSDEVKKLEEIVEGRLKPNLVRAITERYSSVPLSFFVSSLPLILQLLRKLLPSVLVHAVRSVRVLRKTFVVFL